MRALRRSWSWQFALSCAVSTAIPLVGAAIAFKTSAQAENPDKLSPMLVKQLENEPHVRALVVFREKADISSVGLLQDKALKGRAVYDALRKVALSSQAGLVSWLDSQGIAYRRHYLVNFVEVPRATTEILNEILKRPEVERVLPNPAIRLSAVPTSNFLERRLSAVEPGVVNTHAPQVWEIYGKRGEGIVVASADTGVKWDHPAIMRQYRGYAGKGSAGHEYNWHDAIHDPLAPHENLNCKFDVASPCADGDHGTHTVGTMVGEAPDPAPKHGRPGMAPKGQWIACRNMDDGFGSPASYIECNEFFLAPFRKGEDPLRDGDPSRAPHIVNNSWGCPPSEGCEPAFMRPAFQAMGAAGILMVVSAGNDGPECGSMQNPPAVYTGDVLSVGAINGANDQIAYFSSRGPSKLDGGLGPDLVAPGMGVWSATSDGDGTGYDPKDGTSMAGPHVAGAAALLWSVQPGLVGKVNETRELLMKSARPLTTFESCGAAEGSAVPNGIFGHGAVDVMAAVKAALRQPH